MNAEGFNATDTLWVLLSSALVLMMLAPGLAMFYGGMVRKKNILSVMMQCIFLMGLLSIVWAAWGYSLAFAPDVAGGLIGGSDYLFMNGVLPVSNSSTQQVDVPMVGGIPRMVHFLFQMTFFTITPALICGAYAERMKFSSLVVFSVLWGTLVYCPLAHWVWSDNGWLFTGKYAALDFAGGTVVHISSGVSALLCAVILGKRFGFGSEPMPPHNLTYTFLGTALLWVGWFGFNAGSALGVSVLTANAFLATHMSAAAGVLAWAGIEWIVRGKPSALGACSGAIAGLVCITPACGAVTPVSAIVMGLAGGTVCFYGCTTIKQKFGYDDTLDAFGVHGIGGMLGAVLTGVFADPIVTGNPDTAGLLAGGTTQFVNQWIGVLAAVVLAFVGTLMLLKALDGLMGLRVSPEEELRGLDLTLHGEEGYIFL